MIGRGGERQQTNASEAELFCRALLDESQKLRQLAVAAGRLAYACDHFAEESGLLLEQASEPSVEPAPERRGDEREQEYQKPLDCAGPQTVARSQPQRDGAYAVEVAHQHDRREGGDDEALLEYEFEVAVAVDVISEERRRQERAEVGERLQVLPRQCALAQVEGVDGED